MFQRQIVLLRLSLNLYNVVIVVLVVPTIRTDYDWQTIELFCSSIVLLLIHGYDGFVMSMAHLTWGKASWLDWNPTSIVPDLVRKHSTYITICQHRHGTSWCQFQSAWWAWKKMSTVQILDLPLIDYLWLWKTGTFAKNAWLIIV